MHVHLSTLSVSSDINFTVNLCESKEPLLIPEAVLLASAVATRTTAEKRRVSYEAAATLLLVTLMMSRSLTLPLVMAKTLTCFELQFSSWP